MHYVSHCLVQYTLHHVQIYRNLQGPHQLSSVNVAVVTLDSLSHTLVESPKFSTAEWLPYVQFIGTTST
jgi:hypothetical protein